MSALPASRRNTKRSRGRALVAATTLAFALPAFAQQATTAPIERNDHRGHPSMTVHGDSGSAKAILVACGPFMTQTGVGAGGADVSEVEPGFGTFGWGMQGGTINNRLADDFALPGGGCVFHYKWLTYQTSGTTSGTITGMNLNQWSGDPLSGGSVASSGPANSLTSQTWTGVYHVTSTTLSAVNRPILEVDNSAARATGLSPGTYWLDASVTGLLTSGPWGPPVAPHSAADNGRQFLGSAGTECRTAKRPG